MSYFQNVFEGKTETETEGKPEKKEKAFFVAVRQAEVNQLDAALLQGHLFLPQYYMLPHNYYSTISPYEERSLFGCLSSMLV